MDNMNNNRIRESIEIGSVYEALYNKLITTTEILKYLLISPITIRSMIAYKAVCTFDRTQIIDDVPFVLRINNDEYIAIYMLYFGKDHLSGRNDIESLNIARKTTSLIVKMSTMNIWARSIQILCDINHKKINIIPMDYDLIIGGRCINYIQHLLRSNKDVPLTNFIQNDYIDILKSSEYSKYEDIMLDRCKQLKETAPIYWDKIGHKMYSNIILKNVNVKIPTFPRNKLDKYIALFPTLFDANILNMSSLIYNLNLLPLYIQAYVLGFPIHIYMPSKELINKSIELLKDKGIDEYVKIITDKNKIYLRNFNDYITPFETKDILIGNDQDTLFEDPNMYNLFDVIKLYIDTHVYFFTRVEFPTLIDKKINPWLNLEIPHAIIQEINSRYKTAEKYNLPECTTILELLKQVEDDKLYKNNKLHKENLHNINPNDITISQFLSRELFTEALLGRRNTQYYPAPFLPDIPHNYLQPRLPVFDIRLDNSNNSRSNNSRLSNSRSNDTNHTSGFHAFNMITPNIDYHSENEHLTNQLLHQPQQQNNDIEDEEEEEDDNDEDNDDNSEELEGGTTDSTVLSIINRTGVPLNEVENALIFNDGDINNTIVYLMSNNMTNNRN